MTAVGRAGLDHPSLAAGGGSGLHTAVQLLWSLVSNHLPGRFFASAVNVTNATTTIYEHGYGVDFAELTVALYSGTWPNLTRITDPAGDGWTIVATPSFLKTKISVTTPVAGGPWNYALIPLHIPGAGSSSGPTAKFRDITTATTTTITHGLGAKPDEVWAEYYDGTTTIPVDPAAIVTDMNSTQILVNSNGFTFGGGKKLTVYAVKYATVGSM